MKATLVLLPLLGITYMLFFVNPGEDDLSQIVFIYFNSFLQSFQVGCVTRGGHSELSCPGMLRGSCPAHVLPLRAPSRTSMRAPCHRPQSPGGPTLDWVWVALAGTYCWLGTWSEDSCQPVTHVDLSTPAP